MTLAADPTQRLDLSYVRQQFPALAGTGSFLIMQGAPKRHK
jgi:hypothetical protein